MNLSRQNIYFVNTKIKRIFQSLKKHNNFKLFINSFFNMNDLKKWQTKRFLTVYKHFLLIKSKRKIIFFHYLSSFSVRKLRIVVAFDSRDT